MNTKSKPSTPSNEGFQNDLDFDFDFDYDYLHVDRLDKDDDCAQISQWELVNPSDVEEDSYNPSDLDYVCYGESYDPCDLEYVCYDERDIKAGSVVDVKFATLVEDSSVGSSPPLFDQYISGDANLNPSAENKITDSVTGGIIVGDGYEYRNYDDEEDDDDDGDEESDDGLDDELVPRHMRGKLGRERIRKFGSRGCSKMNTSKKPPFLFVKRGCLHGKRCFGIGLKNSLLVG